MTIKYHPNPPFRTYVLLASQIFIPAENFTLKLPPKVKELAPIKDV